jgi:Bacterial RNA polymerase, alpha chain C terminal domain/Sigma-70, region 4
MENTSTLNSEPVAVDHWPVDNAGFNPRVVHCLNQAGVKTVGDLREWSDDQLLHLRHFGTASLENVRWFFRLSKHAAVRAPHFDHVRSLMAEFLNKQEIFVLEQRFALNDPLFRPHMRRKTLQEIAEMMGGMTRERVRQIEEEGINTLRSHLCRELTMPLELRWVDQIQQRGGVITSAELGEWVSDAKLGSYQPWGTFYLFSQVTDSVHFHFDYFSTITPKALGRIEARIFEVLQQANDLVHFDQIKQAVTGLIDDPQNHLVRVLTVVLNHHPDICGTADGRYFQPLVGTPLVVRDVFETAAKPLHFRDLTELYNERMLPTSQRRTGFILRTLNLMPDIQRVSRAVYEFKPVS